MSRIEYVTRPVIAPEWLDSVQAQANAAANESVQLFPADLLHMKVLTPKELERQPRTLSVSQDRELDIGLKNLRQKVLSETVTLIPQKILISSPRRLLMSMHSNEEFDADREALQNYYAQ